MDNYNRRGWINSDSRSAENFRISGYSDYDAPNKRNVEVSLSDGSHTAHLLFDSPATLKKLIDELEAAYQWATVSPSAPKKKQSAR